MIRYFIVLALAGMAIEKELEFIFGILPKTASLAEIFRTMSVDQGKAVAQFADKTFMYLIQAGAGGILGNYLQIGRDITDRARFKNPLDPPALAVPKLIMEQLMTLLDQKTYTVDNFEEFMSNAFGGYKRLIQVAARANDAFGGEFVNLTIKSRKMDVSWIRSVTRRYDEEIGVAEKTRFSGSFGKNPETPFRNDLYELILIGDHGGAARLIKEHFAQWEKNPERMKREMQNLRASVAGRQPVKAGAGGGDREAGRINFLRWAERRLPEEEVQRIKRVDKVYTKTARKLGLMKEEEAVSEADLLEAMRRIRVMAEPQ